MESFLSLAPTHDAFEPVIFIRHHRTLRAVVQYGQAWFPLSDLARLMGRSLTERCTQKLDSDQYRTVWLLTKGNWEESLLISESGAFALLVYHYVPENRALRRWLAQEVLPALDGYAAESLAERPVMADMHWNGGVLRTLQWHSELWVKMRDLPELVQIQHKRVRTSLWRRWMTGWLGHVKSKA